MYPERRITGSGNEARERERGETQTFSESLAFLAEGELIQG